MTGTQNSNSYLTQPEAAQLLRLSARTLERWRVEGPGPLYRKFGRRIVYTTTDVEAWAANCSICLPVSDLHRVRSGEEPNIHVAFGHVC